MAEPLTDAELVRERVEWQRRQENIDGYDVDVARDITLIGRLLATVWARAGADELPDHLDVCDGCGRVERDLDAGFCVAGMACGCGGTWRRVDTDVPVFRCAPDMIDESGGAV